MNLIIDIGNTNIKFTVFQKEKVCSNYILSSLSEIKSFNFNSIKYIMCCSVSENKKEIEKYFSGNLHRIKNSFYLLKTKIARLELKEIPIYFLNKKTRLPISIKYDSINTLGNDRIALAVAANQLNPKDNSLIIDCGTCITYDFINKKGEYEGGAISPGLKMRYDALNNYTRNLPRVYEEKYTNLSGKTTKECIMSGVINGITEELNGIIYRYQNKHVNLKVLLTGGNMNSFVKSIKNDIFADPLLLAKGLNYILEYNVKK